MTDKSSVPPINSKDGDVARVSIDNAKHLVSIVLSVQLKKMPANKGLELIDERLLIIDKQIALPDGKVFLPLKSIANELRNILIKSMS